MIVPNSILYNDSDIDDRAVTDMTWRLPDSISDCGEGWPIAILGKWPQMATNGHALVYMGCNIIIMEKVDSPHR